MTRTRAIIVTTLIVPAAVVLGAGFLWPVLSTLPESITGTGFQQFAANAVYLSVTATTVRIGVETAVLTLVLSYPIAWFIARSSGWRQIAVIILVLLPFLTSALVRTFAWIAVLGANGLINSLLIGIGVVETPLEMLFTEGAVVVALVHVCLPLMVFPLVAVMRKIDPNLLRVGGSLGANRLVAMARILVPLTRPGIRSGLIVTLLFSMASFIAPAILGGPKQAMLAQIIQATVETGSNRSFAAALSVVLAVVAALLVAAISFALSDRIRWRLPVRAPRAETVSDSTVRSYVKRPLLSPRIGAFAEWMPRAALGTYLVLVSVFSLLPLVILVPVSFTSSEVLVFPPPAFSTQWYEALAADERWLRSGLTSVRIAAAAALASTALATLAVLGLNRRRRLTAIADQVFLLPLTVPAVVFALGAYLAYSRLGLVDTEPGLVLAQTVLALPIAFIVVSAAYQGVEADLERAAASLGARLGLTLRRVVLPLMVPGLAVSLLMTLLLSFDESVASVFLSGLNVETLPRRLWSGIRFGTSPEIAAAAVLTLGFAVVIIVGGALLFRVLARRQGGSSLAVSASAALGDARMTGGTK